MLGSYLSSFNQSPGLIDSTTNVTRDIRGEARIVERAFWLGAPALAEAAQFLNKRLQLEAA